MSKSYLQFIGTSSGKVSLKRFHSSILIQSSSKSILVDCGDGISKSLLEQKISFSKIDAIVFSHFHPDHFAGFSSLINQMKMVHRKNSLIIFSDKNSVKFIKDTLYHSYLFEKRFGFKIIFKSITSNKKMEIENDFSFIPKQNTHLDKYKNLDKKKSLSFASFSFLFIVKNKTIFYSADIGSFNDLFLFKDFKLDFFITEITHIQVDEIIKANEILNSKKIFITHISDEIEKNLSAEISKQVLSRNCKIILARDGLKIKIL